ncbi:TPA: toprim domain-containing protein [Pseudomonas aeruginosa]
MFWNSRRRTPSRRSKGYQILSGKEKTVARLKELRQKAVEVYVASDPDREGESIGWHILQAAGIKNYKRVAFKEITKSCISAELSSPRRLDLPKVADEGISVINFFAWLFQAPRASIRFLSHVSPGRAGGALFHRKREGRYSGWHTLLMAASLGNRRPITRAQWTAFYAAYNAIPWQIHNAKPDYNRLFNGCPLDWQDPAWLAITARLRDIKEFYTALDQGNSQVVRQARSALKAYLGHCTYRQAGNLVDDYHQVQRELRATVQSSLPDLVDTDEYTTWEGMLPVSLIDCPNGLQIVELRCPADLYAEHIALAHCIDSYDQAAYRGDCRLLSVREAGRPLASAELELRREHGEPLGRPWNPQHLSTVQLRKLDNDPVPADSPAGQAYRWFMERIRSGAIATNLNWPDMTVHMTRFADGRWKAGLAEATAKWLLTRLENR